MKAPKPGIYRGVDFDTYASWEALNQSTLNKLSRTPAHVRHDLDSGGRVPTRALDLGWLTHMAALEPYKFSADVVVAPKVDRRTTAGKAAWNEFQAAANGKAVVPPDDHAAALAMAAALRAHPTAGEFLRSQGAAEVSLVWDENGIACKARIDRIGRVGEWPIVGDIKTSRDASRHAFEAGLVRYGYGVQAAHYLAGLQALVPIPQGNPFRRFVFCVVESEPPHCVACYELAEETLAQAEITRQRYLRTWGQCVETGRWDGYGDGIDLAGYPAWVFKSWSSEEGV